MERPVLLILTILYFSSFLMGVNSRFLFQDCLHNCEEFECPKTDCGTGNINDSFFFDY